ncbi:hypothetical protein [Rhodanobacter sp. C05]|uniref:hypothetical protein n=1 Tax=Rhodanobacter sp. C05 TaxID=1945855 RepID=UPI001439338D|nr:hypothetical protein [Rhodanobacter sp. C05]
MELLEDLRSDVTSIVMATQDPNLAQRSVHVMEACSVDIAEKARLQGRAARQPSAA